MTGSSLFDPGLQPERTELAWRRTSLGIGVGSLVALRVLPALGSTPDEQLVWLVPGLVGIAFAIVLWTLSRARFVRANRALLDGRLDRMPGGGLMLALTIFVVACGVAGAAIALVALSG
ncbi:uncharacterized membrane protein YidH (DUF202 family) [Agromyces flavus]|uniref:Uncharacterized membrane protein YidH (DUF202 family) n=1 Tax=Agromyces flavus TaxID=589382 RepID=A0A1H1LHW1_9MICO|nr:DUF202 domain-containing protein [Agromyces flavus]MCP2368510.1 uncharacterized membrane protein YidH (DUF202 family) [Agromyces flavus]GGI48249.1 hypothetical protein GCM10010932_29370 [Agromyces flavus]SDR73892.1 protein of unknown function [Agromyces flavus]